MNLQTKLRSLNRAEARLAGQKARLLNEARARARLAAQLEGLVRKIGLPPRDLVFALVDLYKVRLAGRRKGRGRRRRTKITPELRDAVKRRVAGGASMNRTAQEFRLSYAVVMKMIRGAYDQLS
ncbi:MAG TPA: hypothetical protein VHC95_09435 [Opitutales bacterium]|nr:hypothetical protein [Opitutales bacterium]